MGLIPWNNLHHECQSPPGRSLYKDHFSSRVPACFIFCQSNTSPQLSSQLLTQFGGKSIDGVENERPEGTRSMCALLQKDYTVLQRGTFENGIFYLNIFYYYIHYHALD